MKIIITENKLKNVIFKFLDSKKFIDIHLDRTLNNYIYLVESRKDKRAKISVYEKNAFGQIRNWVFVDYKLVNEVMAFFGISREDSLNTIGEWVGDELSFEPQKIYNTDGEHGTRLNVDSRLVEL